MGVSGVGSLRELAQAIVELPVGALPARVVIVPRLRIAHALKRELAESFPKALMGTHFLTPSLAAREVLAFAGVALESGEESLRPERLRQWFDTSPKLTHFSSEVLQVAPGWAEAFAKTLGELESAGVTPDALRKKGGAQLRDLALALEEVQESAGESVTNDALLARATEVLSGGGVWPWNAASLVVVTGHESGVQAALLREIPRAQFRCLLARPAPARWVARAAALFPNVEVRAVPMASLTPTTELSVLQHFLFADPQVLASPERVRSKGRDGSVELEEHAGVDAELEATADWVVSQVRAGHSLDRIAVLVPHAEPMVSLVRSRLQRIPWGTEPMPVFIAGGEAALHTGAGARILTLLRALSGWLDAEALAGLLPLLKTTDDERVSRDDAVALVSSLGTLGGTPGRPEGAREWFPAAQRAQTRLVALIERLEGPDQEDGEARQLWQFTRQRDVLQRLLPSLEALDRVMALLLRDATLSELWAELSAFLFESKSLRLPPASLDVAMALKGAVERADIDGVTGTDALAVIMERLTRLRRTTGRYGQPMLYVGTVRGAVGLGFDAVRLIGLAEGSIPPSLREDAVLGTAQRNALNAVALPSREFRGLLELQAVFRVVVEARHHVTFSFPRAELSGSVHESSSLFIEVAAALGRPNAITGVPTAGLPGGRDLARDAFLPVRKDQRAARLSKPIGEAAWLDRTADRREDRPAHWSHTRAFDPHHVQATVLERRGPLDGYLGAHAAALPMRGLEEERPLSASRLKTLLECPHRFLLENVLSWGEPAGAQPTGAIDARTYGTLVHTVLERFGREHGEAMKTATESKMKATLVAMGEEEFEALLTRYALLSNQVREVERRRMHRDLEAFFAAEWKERKSRTFVDVERSFELALEVEGEPLYVHGFVDRIDRSGKATLVRDYKTGKPHPRRGGEAAPIPELDAQIALYGLVARQNARAWKLTKEVHAAYAYPNEHEPLRLFEEDASVLFDAASKWLQIARTVLSERAFPRRPNTERCGFCAFKVVCGSEGPARSQAILAEPAGQVDTLLAELWSPAEEEESEE